MGLKYTVVIDISHLYGRVKWRLGSRWRWRKIHGNRCIFHRLFQASTPAHALSIPGAFKPSNSLFKPLPFYIKSYCRSNQLPRRMDESLRGSFHFQMPLSPLIVHLLWICDLWSTLPRSAISDRRLDRLEWSLLRQSSAVCWQSQLCHTAICPLSLFDLHMVLYSRKISPFHLAQYSCVTSSSPHTIPHPANIDQRRVH